MTVLRLARSELKRMTAGLMPKLTILALTMVPLLYGAVYLYANWDPYGNLDNLDAALVVEDASKSVSISSEVSARIMEQCFYELDVPVQRLCGAEVPIPYPRHLEEAAIPQPAQIVSTIKTLLHHD